MITFTDSHRTDLNDYDFCGDDYQDDEIYVPNFRHDYIIDAFDNNSGYTAASPRVHAKRVEYAYLIGWAIVRLGEAYDIREATTPQVAIF